MDKKAFVIAYIFSFLMTLTGLRLSSHTATVRAQEVISSPTPTQVPLAHLTFNTCLIPDTTNFRLAYRADYRAGEYRVVGENSGFTLNLGYLEVGQTGGGFGDDNTTYILPGEDVWKKQWFNGDRWQRSGGLPVTNVEEHIQNGFICETGGHTSYYTPTPLPVDTLSLGGVNALDVSVTPTPTPLITPAPTSQPSANENNTSNNASSNSIATGGVNSIQDPAIGDVDSYSNVLGTSTMAATGDISTLIFWGQMVTGALLSLEGLRRVSKH